MGYEKQLEKQYFKSRIFANIMTVTVSATIWLTLISQVIKNDENGEKTFLPFRKGGGEMGFSGIIQTHKVIRV